jgi:hypothetical protein
LDFQGQRYKNNSRIDGAKTSMPKRSSSKRQRTSRLELLERLQRLEHGFVKMMMELASTQRA